MFFRKSRILLSATAIACCLTSHAWAEFDMGPVPGYVSNVGHFFQQRGRDFADIFRAQAVVPSKASSAGVRLRATVLAQAGAAHFEGKMMGMDRRQAGVICEKRDEGGASLLYYSTVQSQPAHECCPTGQPHFDPSFTHHNGWDDGRNRPLSLGAMLQLPALPGLDLGLYPEEATDFVFGFVGLDLLKDDRAPKIIPAPRLALPGEPCIDNECNFIFQKSFDEDLAPFAEEESPNIPSKKKAD